MRHIRVGKVVCLIGAATFLITASPVPAQPKGADPLEALKSPANSDRLKAMKDWGNKGAAGRDAIPVLSGYMRLTNNEIADQAAGALAQIGPAAVAELVKALDDPSAAVRRRALRALHIMGPDGSEAVLAVSALLKSPDAKTRILAAQVLAEMGPRAEPAVAALAEALRDADATVRLWAAQALHDIGSHTVEHVVAALRDEKAPVRLTATQALTVFSDTRAGGAGLAEALHDRDPKVRAASADILIRIGRPARHAIPALLQNLREPNLEVQTRALTAIVAMGSIHDVCLMDALATENDRARWQRAGPKEKLKSHLQHLNGNSLERLGAVLALGGMGPEAKAALPELGKLLTGGNPRIRSAALMAVCAIDPGKEALLPKAADIIAENIAGLRSIDERDPDEVIQLYLLISVAPHLNLSDKRLNDTVRQARPWLGQALSDVPETAMPRLVQAINIAAKSRLGFTEPFCRLGFKLLDLVKDSKNVDALFRAFSELGNDLDKESPYKGAIQQMQFALLKNRDFLDFLILSKIQRIENLAVAKQQDTALVKKRVEQQVFALTGNPQMVWSLGN
jgi:HEAT repeat protein